MRAANFLVLALALALVAPLRADVPKLDFRGYTNDFAGVLGERAVQQVDAVAGEVERKTGAQIAVVLVRTLDGHPIDDYANTLARRWGVGRKENRGIVLLLAVDDRRSRIEVGYGLEPILPDGRTGYVLRSMRPALREGNYDRAVLQAVQEIAGVIAKDAGVTLESQPQRRAPRAVRVEGPDLPWWAILAGLFAILWLISKVGVGPLFWAAIFSGMGRSRGRGGIFGGSLGGGGSSGWDGGGFSGFGGGDFGGGGASSDW